MLEKSTFVRLPCSMQILDSVILFLVGCCNVTIYTLSTCAAVFFFVLEHSMTCVCPTSNLLSFLTFFLNPES